MVGLPYSGPMVDLGQVVTTPGVMDALGTDLNAVLDPILRRHASGDWGDCEGSDKKANDDALDSGARLFSVYTHEGVRLWVITEAKDDSGVRQSTCVLLPSEY